MSRYDELVREHEKIGCTVHLGTLQPSGDATLYVECMIGGKRHGPDGLVLPRDAKLADRQVISYLENTLASMKRKLGL